MSPAEELRTTRKLFRQLTSSPKIRFPKPRGKLEAPKTQGVYIITNPRGKVVHVGRAPRGKNGLWHRLRDHLYGKSSFTKKHLHREPARLRAGYRYQFVEIAKPRQRALLEAYATGMLCPEHLGTG